MVRRMTAVNATEVTQDSISMKASMHAVSARAIPGPTSSRVPAATEFPPGRATLPECFNNMIFSKMIQESTDLNGFMIDEEFTNTDILFLFGDGGGGKGGRYSTHILFFQQSLNKKTVSLTKI